MTTASQLPGCPPSEPLVIGGYEKQVIVKLTEHRHRSVHVVDSQVDILRGKERQWVAGMLDRLSEGETLSLAFLFDRSATFDA